MDCRQHWPWLYSGKECQREDSGAAVGIDVPEDGAFECGNIEEVYVAGLQLALTRGDRELAGEQGYGWQGKQHRTGEDHECCSVEPSRIAEGSRCRVTSGKKDLVQIPLGFLTVALRYGRQSRPSVSIVEARVILVIRFMCCSFLRSGSRPRSVLVCCEFRQLSRA